MIDKLLKLKKNNKVLFWVLFPLVAIAFVVKFMSEYNTQKAKNQLIKTSKKDIDLEAQQQEAEDMAKELILQAKNSGKKASKHEKKASVKVQDPDWHKKG